MARRTLGRVQRKTKPLDPTARQDQDHTESVWETKNKPSQQPENQRSKELDATSVKEPFGKAPSAAFERATLVFLGLDSCFLSLRVPTVAY